MEGLQVGRIVHYYCKSFGYEPRAALVVRVFNGPPLGFANLTVFQDWLNDDGKAARAEGREPRPSFWATSIPHKSNYSEEQLEHAEFGSAYWDWPPRA